MKGQLKTILTSKGRPVCLSFLECSALFIQKT